MRVSAHRIASYVALLVAGLLAAISIARGGFVAAGTDSSAYAAAGAQWQRGEPFRADPLRFWAAWPGTGPSTLPVGFRAGRAPGTEVAGYPPGFPLLVAAATMIVGPDGAYLVAPLMGAVLVWCVFLLGRRLAGDLAGLLAALLVATSPITLLHTVHPMSDVPAAACWTGAWILALGGTASAGLASGLVASLAILIRPNLAPLAGVLVLVIAASAPDRRRWLSREQWKHLAAFVGAAAVGPVVLLWSQAVLNGGMFASSYGDWQALFSTSYAATNLRLYPRLLAQAHTLIPLTGLLTIAVALFRPAMLPSRVIALSAGALMVVNWSLYLLYRPFDHWPFLRFLLPALASLFVLFAGVVAVVTRAVWARARWIAAIIPLLIVPVIAQGRALSSYALHDHVAQARVGLMAHYLLEALPANAALLSFTHSGTLAFETGREVVRLDLLDPNALDRVVDDLTRYGYHPVFVLDQELEVDLFLRNATPSRYGRLDWPPRAVFTSLTSILYFDPADRERYLRGERWAVDTVR